MLPWGPVCRGRFDRAKQNCSVGTLLEPSIKPNQNLRCEVHEKVINTASARFRCTFFIPQSEKVWGGRTRRVLSFEGPCDPYRGVFGHLRRRISKSTGLAIQMKGRARVGATARTTAAPLVFFLLAQQTSCFGPPAALLKTQNRFSMPLPSMSMRPRAQPISFKTLSMVESDMESDREDVAGSDQQAGKEGWTFPWSSPR